MNVRHLGQIPVGLIRKLARRENELNVSREAIAMMGMVGFLMMIPGNITPNGITHLPKCSAQCLGQILVGFIEKLAMESALCGVSLRDSFRRETKTPVLGKIDGCQMIFGSTFSPYAAYVVNGRLRIPTRIAWRCILVGNRKDCW